MEKYKEKDEGRARIECNQCGKEILTKGELLREDILSVTKNWGYFSSKDGIRHSWKLCEACYDRFVQGFLIPAEETDMTELL